MRLAILILLTGLGFAGPSFAQEYRKFIGHRNVNHEGKAYSVFEIRPCPVVNGWPRHLHLFADAYSGHPLSKEFLDANEQWAETLLRGAYEFAKARYTRGGFFTPETGAALEADLQTMFSDRRTVLLITDATDVQGGPVPKIHFMVSVHQDGEGGLPMESRLLGRGLKEKLPRSPEVFKRTFPDDEETSPIGPVRYRFERQSHYKPHDQRPPARQWGTQGIVELKTLVSDEGRTEDFLPLLHQLLIDNLRWTRQPNRTSYPAHNDIVRIWAEDGQDEAAVAIAPQVVPVTRTEKIWLEAPSDALANMYVKRMKFEPALPGHRFPDPHVPGNFVSLLGIDPGKFETEAWNAIQQRPGGKLAKEGFLSFVLPKTFGSASEDRLPAVRFRSPAELAVNERLAPLRPMLENVGPKFHCMRAIVHLGNGDMVQGWKEYMSQFAND